MTVVSAVLIAACSGLAACRDAAWSAPPRYDGAGYALLARALLEGQGYRSIDHPDRPRHAHFPPGYPLLLAATWRVTGVSVVAARLASLVCTVGAVLLAWWWFRRMVPATAALLLGLSLSVNWLWARTAGAIQSEPLYMLLGQATILAATRAARRAGVGDAVVVGVMLAACLLTRQVAVGLTIAVLIDLGLRRRWRQALIVAATAAILISPWLIWMASASAGRTQADLILRGSDPWLARIAGQLAFYVRRIPDQITGPFVEVGTVFGRSRTVTIAADLWAAAATAVIAFGWVRSLRRRRRRLAGLVPFATLLVLLAWPFTEAGRFLVPMIPCILVGAVEGGTGILGWAGRLGGRIGARRAPYGMRVSRLRVIAAGLVLAASLPYSIYALAMGRARAAEESQSDFDAACTWLAGQADRPGPVLARHPGDVFWQTGRPALEVATSERPGDVDADADTIARTIDEYRVAYLIVDQDRYANAPVSPLARFVARFPGRVREVWGREGGRSAVVIYQVEPAR